MEMRCVLPVLTLNHGSYCSLKPLSDMYSATINEDYYAEAGVVSKGSVHHVIERIGSGKMKSKRYSKMPTVRNARSLVTSRELLSGLQIWGKRPAQCIVLSGYNEGRHRQRVRRERQSNSRTRRPWYAIRMFDVSNNGQPP